MRRRGYFRRALARVSVDRTGEPRWVIVNKVTGKPSGLKVSYPNERIAQGHCGPDEEPRLVTVAGNAGPFADQLQIPAPQS